jgi:hypothetical protein
VYISHAHACVFLRCFLRYYNCTRVPVWWRALCWLLSSPKIKAPAATNTAAARKCDLHTTRLVGGARSSPTMSAALPRGRSCSCLLLLLVVLLQAIGMCVVQAWKSELKEVVALAPYLREQLRQNPDNYMANLQIADGFRVLVLAERGTGASVSEMPEYWEAVHSYKKVLELKPENEDLHVVYLSLATLLHRNLQASVYFTAPPVLPANIRRCVVRPRAVPPAALSLSRDDLQFTQ